MIQEKLNKQLYNIDVEQGLYYTTGHSSLLKYAEKIIEKLVFSCLTYI